MLPTEGRTAGFVGRVGAARSAVPLAACKGLALARQHLGSLDRVRRVVRLGGAVATSGDVRDHPSVADGASALLQDVFGPDNSHCRLVLGVAGLPLGAAVELELSFDVEN